jgi:hypothetical protein
MDGWRATKGNGQRAMTVTPGDARVIVDRACARLEVLDARARRGVGVVIDARRALGPGGRPRPSRASSQSV